MKLLLLAPELLPNRGGIGVYCSDIIRGLPPVFDVTVLSLLRRDSRPVYSAAEMEAHFQGRARIHVVSRGRDSFVYNAGFQWAVLRWMREWHAERHFDLVHSQHAHMPDLVSRALLPGPTTVRTVHTTIAGQRGGIRAAMVGGGGHLEPAERWQLMLAPFLDRAERSVLGRHDFTIAISDWMRDQLIEAGLPQDRVETVRPPVDSHRFHPLGESRRTLGSAPDRRVIHFSGRPTVVKGAAVIAAALPGVLREVPDAELVLTGALKEQFVPLLGAAAGSLLSKIRFLGFLPHDDLPAVVASPDVAVVPSFYENIPARILESMSCGVPVVASSVGGIPEVVREGHNGLLVPPGRPDALAEALVRLLTDEAARRRMGDEARRTVVDGFDRAQWGAKVGAAYRHALASRG